MAETEILEPKPRKQKRKLKGKKLSMKQFMQMKFSDVSHLLSPELRDSLGQIEDGFDIFIFGNSGDGKSSFSAQVVKELSPLGRILHILYEEGHSRSAQMNHLRAQLQGLEAYDVIDDCPYEDLVYLLGRKQAPKIIIIDSFQYSRFTKEQWLSIKAKYVKGKKKKIFVVISHADGRKPRGSVATDCMYDAQIKVFVKGKVAFVKSRYEGKKNYVIWDEGAKSFWGRRYKSMLTKQIF